MKVLKCLLLISLLGGCTQQQDSATEVVAPPYFAETIPRPENNPLTSEGIKLGQRLFFDPGLSANGKVSCASCHLPEQAFSEGVALSSKGISGKQLHRNSPALFNLAWHPAYFWDGGATDLESQIFAPLMHPDEMGADLNQLLIHLRKDTSYSEAFRQAFQTDSVQSIHLAYALGQYLRSLIADHSVFDQYKRGEASLDSTTLRGYRLFKSKQCASCHPQPFFTDFKYHNIGLDSSFSTDNEGMQMGRFRITFDSADIGKYKTPSLRNVALTAPYMHDGRFNSLEEVLEHYNSGVQLSATVDPRVRNGIALTAEEKKALVAFIESLTEVDL